jgi:hypothetical protein
MVWEMELAEWKIANANAASVHNRLGKLKTWVDATVDPLLLLPVLIELAEGEDQSLHAIVKKLMEQLQPSDTATAELVREDYRAHMQKAKQGRTTPEQWYRDWHALYMRGKAYKLAELEGTLAVYDFLDALAPKLATDWAINTKREMVTAQALGKPTYTLAELGIAFSALAQHQASRPKSLGVFATIGEAPNNGGSHRRTTTQSSHEPVACPCTAPGQPNHAWPVERCYDVLTAIGSLQKRPRPLTPQTRTDIVNRLSNKHYKKARARLVGKGHQIPPPNNGLSGSLNSEDFSAGVCAALLDPTMLQVTPGVYSTMDYDAHPLSNSTILDNGAAVHLVNSSSLLDTFTPVKGLHTVEAGTQAFPISGYGTRVLKGFLKLANGKRVDLTLSNVAVVEGFHVNIVSEARLQKAGLWYLGLDNTLRIGNLAGSTVVATLRRELNLTFMEYKPITVYPAPQINVIPRVRTSYTSQPRSDSEDLWHARAGHLGPKALEALVRSARGVRIKGPARLECQSCALTHAKQVISRRPKERAPRPFWRIA